MVSPVYLSKLLEEHGFENAVDGGPPLSVGAQRYFVEIATPLVQEAVLAVAKLHRCTSLDWTTMGAFRVVLARRCDGNSPA
jgi:hypothetical protein